MVESVFFTRIFTSSSSHSSSMSGDGFPGLTPGQVAQLSPPSNGGTHMANSGTGLIHNTPPARSLQSIFGILKIRLIPRDGLGWGGFTDTADRNRIIRSLLYKEHVFVVSDRYFIFPTGCGVGLHLGEFRLSHQCDRGSGAIGPGEQGEQFGCCAGQPQHLL